VVLRRWSALAVLALVASCGDDDAETSAVDDPGTAVEAITEVTWTTTYDIDGSGYVLTVDGVVGDDAASYTMHVELLLDDDGGDMSELIPGIAGAAVNGMRPDAGADAELLGIDRKGRTEVRVAGDQRWYRSPWLLHEADFAMGDAEWVQVGQDEEVLLDIVTAVLNERYDDALRTLLDDVGTGTPLAAPTPDEASSELDELLTPWVGLTGPAYPIGAPATVTGDEGAGEATWSQVLTYEPDGADGELRGHVRWSRGTEAPLGPPEPNGVTTVAEVSARFGG
jgi:hypothetical protein